MSYTTDPQYTIQKIAREVFMKYEQGEDPFELLVKQAKSNKLTPQVVTSAVHAINNELYLDHYKKASKGNPKTLKPKDVLEALGLSSEKTASSPCEYKTDLKDFKKKASKTSYLDRITHRDIQADSSTVHIKKQVLAQRNLETEKIASEIDAETTKIAVQIAGAKRDLYNECVLSMSRHEIEPEEIYLLGKAATDVDVAECFGKALDKVKAKVDQDKFIKKAENMVGVNKDAKIYKHVDFILNKKADFNKLFHGMSTLELAKLRTEGIKKLMEASYGFYRSGYES